MVTFLERPFKTIQERNEVYEAILLAFKLCDNLEDIQLTIKEVKADRDKIKLFDELTATTPITELLNLAILEIIETIKEKENGRIY